MAIRPREIPIGLIIREGFDIAEYVETARKAEAAKIHMLFTADWYSTSVRAPRGNLEPITMLSAIAMATERTGLVATVSTTFFEPFNLSRQLASLDHISRGRAGWNMITSSAGQENFGPGEFPPHTERYERADEFATVVEKLWESWGEGAVIAKERGFDVDASKVQAVDHRGKYYEVAGPSMVARTPQGRPVLFQAGTSEDGMTFGARHADAIFTTGLEHVADSKEIYQGVKSRVASVGRNPDEVLLFPGLFPIVASTDAEAKRILDEQTERIDFDAQRMMMKNMFGDVDVSGYDLDKPLPPEALPHESEIQGRQSRYWALKHYLMSNPDRTLRDLLTYHAAGAGHWVPVGSPETVADQLQERYEAGVADGFIIIDAYSRYPGSLDAILEGLIPELQRRGIFHHEYESDTLRGLLGLPDYV